MQRLLAPDGCPWDREQSMPSLRKDVLEEACEVIDAIVSGDREQIREELKTAGAPSSTITVGSGTTFRIEGVPSDRDVDFRRVADTQASAVFDRSTGAGGTYDFTMKPNIIKDLRSSK